MFYCEIIVKEDEHLKMKNKNAMLQKNNRNFIKQKCKSNKKNKKKLITMFLVFGCSAISTMVKYISSLCRGVHI